MSGLVFLSEWQDPAYVRRELARVRGAASKNVHFGMSGDDSLLMEQAWRVANVLEQAYAGEWLEMRMGDRMEVRFNEGKPQPVTVIKAFTDERDSVRAAVAAAQGQVIVWREEGVPEWAHRLVLGPQAVGWIGNDKQLEALNHAG